jgi:SAM-dependent methyltransferase
MDRKEQEQSTRRYYDNQAADFKAFRGEGVSQYWQKELAQFHELLPEGTILEVGCGLGNEAILLREMGYDYVGTDLSMGMLAVAKKRTPEAVFIQQDLRDPGFNCEFDGLVGIASLLHLEKEELTPALIALRNELRSGGVGFFTLKEGTGTEVDSKGRFYTYYSPEELTQHFLDAGFNLIDQSTHPEKGHDFICMFVQNP